MPALQEAIEEYLAALPPDDWHALCARVRPPDEDIKEVIMRELSSDTTDLK